MAWWGEFLSGGCVIDLVWALGPDGADNGLICTNWMAVKRECFSSVGEGAEEVQRCRCRCRCRCRVKVVQRCRDAHQMHRCRGAEVQMPMC